MTFRKVCGLHEVMAQLEWLTLAQAMHGSG
jgi:hypothetical protein